MRDVPPGTREAVVDAVEDALVVVDDRRVLDANRAFREWFDAEAPTGKELSAVLAEQPALRERIETGNEGVVEAETAAGSRSLEVALSPVRAGGERVGRLAHLHDETDWERRCERLERENEQLDRFASVVSHDLRNPLDVALGRTNALKERVEDPEVVDQLERISDAHDRMQRIIADVLSLAREGEAIDSRESVEVATLAADAWTTVATEAASLAVEGDRVVSADRDRLSHVFENLFRNAVQHAGSGVTVTVGPLPDGFYVEDDGPGILPVDRERVLEPGYTGSGSGTGLGLAIVEQVVDAHGWDLTVAASDDGGARFEVTGVET
ncbi:MAG: PAS domain-containing sensor histidine kinase [Haloarculaceae archaeon]